MATTSILAWKIPRRTEGAWYDSPERAVTGVRILTEQLSVEDRNKE